MRSLNFLRASLLFVFAASLTSKAEKLPKDTTSNNHFITTTDSVKLFIEKRITNKPVCIFVHGGPGAWSRSFKDLNGNQLESLFSMVYYDQRGCGRSTSAKNYSLSRMAQDIEEIRTSLHAEKIYLIAHSFGGILAEKYAETHPGHLRGMILLNCTLDIHDSMANQISYIDQLTGNNINYTDANTLSENFSKARGVIDSLKISYKMLTDSKANNDKLEAIDKLNPGNHDFANAAWSNPEYFNDFSINTKQVKTSTLIITGLKDYSIGPNHYKKFHYPDQTVSAINGGHLLYYENTAELLKSIKKWLN